MLVWLFGYNVRVLLPSCVTVRSPTCEAAPESIVVVFLGSTNMSYLVSAVTEGSLNVWSATPLAGKVKLFAVTRFTLSKFLKEKLWCAKLDAGTMLVRLEAC